MPRTKKNVEVVENEIITTEKKIVKPSNKILQVEDFIPGLYRMHIRVHFFDTILGTSPQDPNVYKEFLLKKNPELTQEQIDAELEMLANAVEFREGLLESPEVDAATKEFEKHTTIFLRHADGTPCTAGHQWKGFYKEKIQALNFMLAKKISAFKKKVDLCFFIEPDFPAIITQEKMDIFQRPLRTSGPQGERVALSSSEQIYPGAYCEFDTIYTHQEFAPLIRQCLDYALLSGTAQWRSAGHGRFMWEELDDEGNQIGGTYNPEFFKRKMDMAMACSRSGGKG